MNLFPALASSSFASNQIVRARGEQPYVILGFRLIDGEDYAQVKPVHPVTHAPGRGEFALPVSALRLAA